MKYLVAVKVGGIMEQPHITYEKVQVIEAESEEDAVKIYNKKNNCSYFYGTVVGNEHTGQTVFSQAPKRNSFT